MRVLFLLFYTWLLTTRAAEPGGFTVGWWNVENFGVTDRFIAGHYVRSAMKPESEQRSVVAILQRLNPDILGVAEILQDPQDRYLKLFRSLLKNAGLDYPYLATAKGADPRIQMALFSRYPLDEADFTQDTFPATLVSKTGETLPTLFQVNRGFLNVTVHLSASYSLQIITAHLKSKRPEKNVEGETVGESGDEFVRRQEAILLRKHIDQFMTSHPQSDLLVMGDLNDTYRSKTLRAVRGPKGTDHPLWDLPLADYLGDQWTELFLPEYDYARIDYMFVNGSLWPRFVREKSFLYRWHQGEASELNHYEASDHRPLLATFHFPG